MKITKYHQSCLLVETKGNRILVDPGTFGYTNEVEKEWKDIDLILITHHHSDHCFDDVINQIIKRDQALVLATAEVIKNHHISDSIMVKKGEILPIHGVYIEVTQAEHGTFADKPPRCGVEENVGFIIEDGMTRLYITSDTISFPNDYECDVIAMPFNGNGLTFGLEDGIEFAKRTKAKEILPIHREHPLPEMNPSIEELKKALEETHCQYNILEVGESVEY